jgi:hypothetical protein
MRAKLCMCIFLAAALTVITACSKDPHGKEGCRIIASVRDRSGNLMFQGTELDGRMIEAYRLSLKSKSAKIIKSIKAMEHAAEAGDHKGFVEGLDAWISACNTYFPIAPVRRHASKLK